MNHLYTNVDGIGGRRLIKNIDAEFNYKVSTGSLRFDDRDKKILEIIDHSTLNSAGTHIDTPYAQHVSLDKISSGAKTAILANHSESEEVVSIEECGENVLNLLFNDLDDKNYYTSYCLAPDYLNKEIEINGSKKIYKSVYELLEVWKDNYDL